MAGCEVGLPRTLRHGMWLGAARLPHTLGPDVWQGVGRVLSQVDGWESGCKYVIGEILTVGIYIVYLDLAIMAWLLVMAILWLHLIMIP